MADPDITGSDLAQWLQEAGRRRVAPAREEPVSADDTFVPAAPKPRRLLQPRVLALLLLATLAFLPYLFANVQVEILSLRSIIAFVFPGWQH